MPTNSKQLKRIHRLFTPGHYSLKSLARKLAQVKEFPIALSWLKAKGLSSRTPKAQIIYF